MITSRYFFSVCALLVLTACSQPPAEQSLDRLVKVKKFSFYEHSRKLEYPGRVEARHQTELAFQVKGLLVKRLFDVGDFVAAGAAIAMLDSKDYLLSNQRFAGERQAAYANYQRAKKDLVRANELHKKHFIGQSELDRVINTQQAAKATLQALQAQHAQSLQQNNYTQLLAPADGVITRFSAEVGDVLGSAESVAQFAWQKDWEFVTALAESDINLLQKGAAAQVNFWAFPEKIFLATIREISPVASMNSPSYQVKLSLQELPSLLKLGMTGHVSFLSSVKKLAVLPASSLLSIADKTQVLIVDPTTLKTHLQEVTLGESVGDQLSILSGIEEGQLVVVAGASKIKAGATVRLLEP